MSVLDAEQKRTFVALACKVAWADGVVAVEERAHIVRLIERLGGVAVTADELDAWLSSGAPPAELASLPPGMADMLVYEAMQLIESDGVVADEELAFVEGLLSRVQSKAPTMPIGKIFLGTR